MDTPERSRAGRVSLALSLVSLVAAIPMAWVRIAWEHNDPYGQPNYAAGELFLLIGAILVSGVTALAGLVSGIAGLLHGRQDRLRAVIGIALSVIVLAGIVTLFVVDIRANE